MFVGVAALSFAACKNEAGNGVDSDSVKKAETEAPAGPEGEAEGESAPAATMGDFAPAEPAADATWEQAKPEETAAPAN